MNRLDDLEEYLDNVLVILPSASVGLYTWFKDRCKVYFGYINKIEKINVYKYVMEWYLIKFRINFQISFVIFSWVLYNVFVATPFYFFVY